MAEDQDQRTEEPTGKRLGDLRKQGQFPQSPEVQSAASLLVGALLLAFASKSAARASVASYADVMEWMLRDSFELADASQILLRSIGYVLLAMTPIWAVMMVVALVAGFAQSQGLFEWDLLKPKWSKLNPFAGLMGLFGIRGLTQLFKQVIKLAVLGFAGWIVFKSQWDSFLALFGTDAPGLASALLRLSVRTLLTLAIVYAIIASIDYMYEKRSFLKKNRMTKAEVKEEAKQAEGDPQIKGKIRSMMRSRARQRMLLRVKDADVVIVNPTHRAVAIRFAPEECNAPVVLAMGERKLAEKIRALAEENRIPIYEDRPLAIALLQMGVVGQPIPQPLYLAVAKVLHFVYHNMTPGGRPTRRR